MRTQRKINKELRNMFNESAIFEMELLTKILIVSKQNLQTYQGYMKLSIRVIKCITISYCIIYLLIKPT